MVSFDTCAFTSADELLAGRVKGIDRGFPTGAGVASTKPAGWGEVELFNTAGQNLQVTLPSTSCMTFTDGLGSTLGAENRDHMVAYLRGASVQPATMQGLRPVDASFTGYPDAVHVPNTLLFSHEVAQNMSVDGINRQQQNLTGFPPPPAVTHSSFAATYNTNVAHAQANPLSNHVTSNGYNWSTVNEFAFLPSTIDQRLVAKPTQMEPESHLKSGVIEFNSRPPSVHIEQASVLRNVVALGLSIDNSQPLSRPSQNLSLSLSPHQHTPQLQQLHYDNGQPIGSGLSSSPEAVHTSADGSGRKGDRQMETWVGPFGVLGSGYQKSVPNGSNTVVPLETNLQMFAGLGVFSGSRYLRAAQTLLEELVSVGRGVNNNSLRLGHLESSMPSSLTECSFSKAASLSEKVTGASHKEQVACFKSALSTVSDPEQKISTIIEHTSQRSQELQTKKARLLAMLDEVDRRYKQYYNQMQTVVNSFEAAAGFGAAKMYTSLALQTISKHFRSLRDAIGEQIRSASRALGEEDFPLISFGRLHCVDQQINQQAALQRLGMVPQHTWRPQRGLPERAVVVLRAWLFEHFLHPYPKDADKHMLAKQTGLTRNQVSNWFINARVRLWKPMVEEMYLEELKDADVNASRCNRSNLHREDCDNLKSGTASIVNQQNVVEFDSSSQGYKHGRVEPDSSDEAVVTDEQIVSDYQRAVTNNMLAQVAALDVADPHLLRGAKKSRNGLGMDPLPEGVKLEGAGREEGLDNGNKQNFHIRGFGSGLETFHLGVMGRGEEDGGFSTVPAGYNDVSLTLGLQHCDSLSLVEAQHQHYYLHQHQQQGLLSHFAGAGL